MLSRPFLSNERRPQSGGLVGKEEDLSTTSGCTVGCYPKSPSLPLDAAVLITWQDFSGAKFFSI